MVLIMRDCTTVASRVKCLVMPRRKCTMSCYSTGAGFIVHDSVCEPRPALLHVLRIFAWPHLCSQAVLLMIGSVRV